MKFNKYYHNTGKNPDRYYYQQENNPQESYNKHIKKTRYNNNADEIRQDLTEFVEKTLDDILAELVF